MRVANTLPIGADLRPSCIAFLACSHAPDVAHRCLACTVRQCMYDMPGISWSLGGNDGGMGSSVCDIVQRLRQEWRGPSQLDDSAYRILLSGWLQPYFQGQPFGVLMPLTDLLHERPSRL